MNLNLLNRMFKPTSVAVIGASDEPGSLGEIAVRNLLAGKFIGPVMPMTTEATTVHGLETYRSVDTLPLTPDLALICTPPDTVVDHIEQLGHRGAAGAVILCRGFDDLPEDERTVISEAAQDAAQRGDMHLLGPGSMGFLNPQVGVNAGLAHCDAEAGRIAFVTQSGSLYNTILDWAHSRSIGFSYFISLGEILDIGFGSILDFLNADPRTKAIMLYIESIRDARTFMSAARAVARNKPVLVIKAGRSDPGAKGLAMSSSHLPGLDDVYDAAFRRSGMLRVFDIDSLFESVETIARSGPLKGEKTAILSNGLGSSLLAVDLLALDGVRFANVSEEGRSKLHELGLYGRFDNNPVILQPDAPPEAYSEALSILLKEKDPDAIIVFHAPSAAVKGAEVAEAVAKTAKRAKRTVLAGRLGGEDTSKAKDIYAQASIPSFSTPESAVRAFLHLAHYRRNQELLMETPASLPAEFDPDAASAKRIVEKVLSEDRELLTAPETMQLLSDYQIPTVETRLAVTPEEAAETADELGFPVAVKLLSPDIVRKSQAGAVVLDLDSKEAVFEAAESMRRRVCDNYPDICVNGFIVQRMSRRPEAFEVFLAAGVDPIFGHYLRFGHGGAAADIIADNAVGLPPLNMSLAREMIRRTRIHRLLLQLGERGEAKIEAVCLTLVKVSQLLIDIPHIHTLLINPLYVDMDGVLALDAQLLVERMDEHSAERLAIRPYPKELEVAATMTGGRHVLIRPIRPEDEPQHWDFFHKLSVDDVRFRFFGLIRELPRAEMVRLTQIDYNREMAFIATSPDEDGNPETLGVVRAQTKPDNSNAEFAIVVRSDLKGQGLGRLLMDRIIDYCRSRKTEKLVGHALLENKPMATLAEKVGFHVTRNFEEDMYDFEMDLLDGEPS